MEKKTSTNHYIPEKIKKTTSFYTDDCSDQDTNSDNNDIIDSDNDVGLDGLYDCAKNNKKVLRIVINMRMSDNTNEDIIYIQMKIYCKLNINLNEVCPSKVS